MTKETKVDTPVRTVRQLKSLTTKVVRLEKENQSLTEQKNAMKRTIVRLTNVIDTDLTAELKVDIMSNSEYTEPELEALKYEELETISEAISKSAAKGATVYKSIRAGTASKTGVRSTVGNLFGKTRKEVLDMGGDF